MNKDKSEQFLNPLFESATDEQTTRHQCLGRSKFSGRVLVMGVNTTITTAGVSLAFYFFFYALRPSKISECDDEHRKIKSEVTYSQ